MNEIYKRYRPKSLDGIVGQDKAIASIRKLVEKDSVPHAILLTGPSGTGKTTIARILKRILKCSNPDYREVDCATTEKPLEVVRDIRRNMQLQPMEGPCRIFFLEEVQSLSRAGFSQQALLKLLEDVPPHVYFILATTDPQKLHRAVHTRCSEIKLASLSSKALEELVLSIVKEEKMELAEDVLEEIVEVSEGSARKALVILEQVGFLPQGEQLEAIRSTTLDKDEAFELAKLLMFGSHPWPEVAKILRGLGDSDPESIRYLVLSFARSCMIGKEDRGPNMKIASRAFAVIDVFSSNFYDSKHAGLAAACWEVMNP